MFCYVLPPLVSSLSSMVRGGTDFRKQAGIRRKKRTGPVNKWKKQKVDTQPDVIDMVVESSSGEVDEVPGLSEQNESVGIKGTRSK